MAKGDYLGEFEIYVMLALVHLGSALPDHDVVIVDGRVDPTPERTVAELAPRALCLGVTVLTCMFYLVPNTKVQLRDAIAGGLLASLAFELGKRGFTNYLVKVPTYKALYGAFAALPMFLLWVYFSWLVTLVAAMMTANLALTRRRPAGKPARV